ncbi:hypothetical protein HYH02_008384 [Chlamydomonas schloesseri]|uniref:Uncharacterized protein n=1 Tax=Chlamydomonas schloesseri TaxID=2026947 RepID=A0A835WGI1_9CHLO|nr:hypothetical protein HYH02_008384 [Chlamydomonas schloesseri]|eukprot:KAG2446824.1 hypothetical protein HYH02_008384 [Chlamydomonas schloesseri]
MAGTGLGMVERAEKVRAPEARDWEVLATVAMVGWAMEAAGRGEPAMVGQGWAVEWAGSGTAVQVKVGSAAEATVVWGLVVRDWGEAEMVEQARAVPVRVGRAKGALETVEKEEPG